MEKLLQCRRCKKEVEPILTPVGKHIKATCPACKQYIKFISQTPLEETRIWFGKYRGTLLTEILAKDREYLEWIMKQEDIRKRTLKERIAELMKKLL